jgi:hypothetical protein
MTTYTKNYGLSGISDEIQFGKEGGFIFYDSVTSTFSARQVTDTEYANIVGSSITAETGNISISRADGVFDIDGTEISLLQSGVLKFNGNKALSIPVGNNAHRPEDAQVGMVRINNQTTPPFAEFYNGSAWEKIGQALTFTATGGLSITVTDQEVTINLETVQVSRGGTGVTSLVQNQLMYGTGAEFVGQSSNLTFDPAQNTLTAGGTRPVVINGNNATISAGAEDSDLVLLPNGTGKIVVSGTGSSTLQTNAGEELNIQATNSRLNLISQSGDTAMILASDAINKVTVVGPTPVQYSNGLADADLVNKYYVDNLVSSINGGTFG